MTATPPAGAVRAAWDTIASGYDTHVTTKNLGLAEVVLDRIDVGSGTRLLDVAAGSGAVSLPAARRGADVTAVDISPAMVERLAQRAAVEGLPVTAQVMDGEHLELDDDSFDVAASQFGVMLFPDLARGIAEMARVTRPTGTVALVVFGGSPEDEEFIGFFLAAVRAVTEPGTVAPSAPLPPFRLADPAVLEQHLAAAELADVQVHTVDYAISLAPSASSADLWPMVTNSNPIAAAMAQALSPAKAEEARRVLDGMLRERASSADPCLHNPVHVATGVAR